MNKSLGNIIVIFIFLFTSGCQDKAESKNQVLIKTVFRNPIIPEKINWDTIRLSDNQVDSFSNYKTFYFYNDSIAYIFKCVNKYENDSILFAVENVEEFKGRYHVYDSIIRFEMRRVAEGLKIDEHSIEDVFADTLKLLNNGNDYKLFYKNNKYKVTKKFEEESFNRLLQLIQ